MASSRSDSPRPPSYASQASPDRSYTARAAPSYHSHFTVNPDLHAGDPRSTPSPRRSSEASAYAAACSESKEFSGFSGASEHTSLLSGGTKAKNSWRNLACALLCLTVVLMGAVLRKTNQELLKMKADPEYSASKKSNFELHRSITELSSSNWNLSRLNEELTIKAGKLNQQNADLQHKFGMVSIDLKRCQKDNADLSYELGKRALECATNVGTGGDSWVCSDLTPQWLFGYSAPENLPSANATAIKSQAFPLNQSSKLNVDLKGEGMHIVGFKVVSRLPNNGWWRKADLEVFGGARVSFEAKAPFMGTADYDVVVFYVEL